MIKKSRAYLLFVKEWRVNYCHLKAMEETRLVQKLLVKLWSQFELLCGMPANVKNKNPMDKLGR